MECRETLKDLLYPISKESYHAALRGLCEHVSRPCPRLNQLFDLLGRNQQLLQRHPSFEAGAVAGVTARSTEKPELFILHFERLAIA